MLTTDITCADEFGRFLKITDDYSWEAINALYNSLRNWLKRKKAIFA